MGLGDLSEDCIAAIVARTSPWDACRLASVSRSFAAAVHSNTVWEMMLPSDYARICPQVSGHPSKREIVQALADGIWLVPEKQWYVLLRRSGGICLFLSAQEMNIAWGNDTRFWSWEYSTNSCFPNVAHLLAVCWLEVNGTWNCRVPPGTYSVSWRLRIANPEGGCHRFLTWRNPLRFAVETDDGQTMEKELNLWHVESNVCEQWFEFDVGQVVVRGDRMKAQELGLSFSIKELDCSFWKGGLFLDCVSLRPSLKEDVPVFFRRTTRSAKLRRHGVF